MKWVLLVAVLLAEFLLFDRMTSRHHAWIYPRWNDQIQPLTEAYTSYEHRRTHGFWSGLGHALTKPAAQGTLHSFWALLVFEAAGEPSRSAALAVNMLAFLAWQAAFFFAVLRGSGSRGLAWAAVGLTLALGWQWSGLQGSATDFRLDQVSMCMMGLALAAALLTDGFRSRSWSVVFGVAVGLTLLTRYLTGTYFAVIFVGCLGWTLWSGERRRRALNLVLAGAVAAALTIPCFWFNWREIYEHYWIGHYFNADGLLWSTQLTFAQASRQLWRQLCVDQLGSAFWAAAGLLVVTLGGAAFRAGRRPPRAAADATARWARETGFLSAIFLLAPALVLALQNNDRMIVVVLGVAVPGAIGLVLALGAGLWARAVDRLEAAVAARFSAGAAVGVLLVGGGYFVARQTTDPHTADFATEVRRVYAITDRVFAAVRADGMGRPRVAVDQVTDYFDGTILSVIGYERHRVWLPFIMQLPTGIAAAPEALLMDHLAQSDFVFVTEDGPPGPWPYDRQMTELRPKLLAWCEAQLRLVERFTVFGRRMALYQRPEIGAAPVFRTAPELLGSTRSDFAAAVEVARGPSRFQATGLPAGLELDGETGAIRGRPAGAGRFTARITASNQAGSTTGTFTFHIAEVDFTALVNGPGTGTTGGPVEIRFAAFDAGGKLNYVEVTNLTTQVTLGRLHAVGGERTAWSGRYPLTFSQPGLQQINLRFVRFDPAAEQPYAFIDRLCEITVLEAAPAGAVGLRRPGP